MTTVDSPAAATFATDKAIVEAIRWCGEHLPRSTADIVRGASREGRLVLALQMLGDERTTRALVAGFRQRFPFIEPTWTTGYAVELQPMLAREFEAGPGRHDHFQISTDLTAASRLRDAGALGQFVVSQDAAYPDTAKCSGYWYARTRTPVVTAYRRGALSEREWMLIRTYEGLGDPCFRGRLGILDVSASMAAMAASVLMSGHAPSAWDAIAANRPIVRATGGPLIAGLLDGTYDLAVLAPLGTSLQAARSGAPVEFVCSAPTPRIYGAMGVISSVAPNPNAARLWADWSTSKEGSDLFSELTGHISPRLDAGPSWVEAQSWYFEDQSRSVNLDPEEYAPRQAEVVARFRRDISAG